MFHRPTPVSCGDSSYQHLFVGFSLVEVHREKQMELNHLLMSLFPDIIRSKKLRLYFDKKEKIKETLNALMVFLVVLLFTQSDEKTFFTVILKLTNIYVPLR